MKIKYYLRGLGTGIIFTAIVLMIIYSYRTTDSKTIERARELGMVMPGEASKQELAENDKNTEENLKDEKTTPDKDSNNNTQEQTLANDDEKESDTTEPSTQEPDTTEADTTESDTMESDTTEPDTEESTTENQTSAGKEITFTISNGMYSETVSQKLYELGVIDDAAGFNSYLVQNGYAGKIRTGTYTFTTGMSYADVAAILSP